MERARDLNSGLDERLARSNRLSIFDLFVLVACFAVAAFFASLGYWLVSLLWLGFLAGVKLRPCFCIIGFSLPLWRFVYWRRPDAI